MKLLGRLGWVGNTVAVFLLVVLLFFFYGDRGYFEYRRLLDAEKKILADIETLERRRSYLYEKIILLKKDKRYFEGVAREKLGMVKPNETVYELQFQSE